MKKLLLHIVLWLLCGNILAQKTVSEGGSVEGCYLRRNNVSLGMGYTNQYDTYLSPQEYRGPQLDILWNKERFLKNTCRESKNASHVWGTVCFQSLLDVQLHTSTRKNNSMRMYGADFHYDAGWYYNWLDVIAPGLRLKTGGQVGGTLGGLYINRSGNNPANAHAAVRLSASVGAEYSFNLCRTPLVVRYQADVPVLGAAFSPDYEQSYYELYKYGYCHNICLTTPANAFSIRQMATIAIGLRHGFLTVGYKADLRQASLNHLRQHQYAHSFMIGWEKKF